MDFAEVGKRELNEEAPKAVSHPYSQIPMPYYGGSGPVSVWRTSGETRQLTMKSILRTSTTPSQRAARAHISRAVSERNLVLWGKGVRVTASDQEIRQNKKKTGEVTEAVQLGGSRRLRDLSKMNSTSYRSGTGRRRR